MLSQTNYIEDRSKLHAAACIKRFPVSALQVEVKIYVGDHEACAHSGKGCYTYNPCVASYLEYNCSICIEKKCEGYQKMMKKCVRRF